MALHIVTIVFAVFAVLAVWLYLPRTKQVWLLCFAVAATALFVNVWMKM